MSTRTLAELARELGAELVGDGSVRIEGVAGIKEAANAALTEEAGGALHPPPGRGGRK